MRNAFAEELMIQAEVHQELVFLSGDIGNRIFNPFKEKFSKRFYNCGIAEGNMIGVASGLSMSGLKPVAYTITPFITARCYEQIKIDVCYNNTPVIVVGVGAGFSYAQLGATHHSLDDISLLKNLPNMNVFCPGDAKEVKACLKEALSLDKPVYIRLGKKNEPVFNDDVPDFKSGTFNQLKTGNDVAFLSCGNILPVAFECSETLKEHNISSEIISTISVKPFDEGYLSEAFKKFKLIISIEEHGVGGFSDVVLQWMNKNNIPPQKYIPFYAGDKFYSYSGGQKSARELAGLSAENIVPKILEMLK